MTLLLPQGPRHRRERVELGAVEWRDERRNRTGGRNAGELGSVMQHPRRSPGVPQILEGEEVFAHTPGQRPVLRPTRLEELLAECGCDAPRPGGEPPQPVVAHVHDGRPFANAADDAGRVHAAKQAVQVGIAGRLASHDGILDGDGDPVAHQPADGIETGLEIRSESVLGLEVQDERDAGEVRNLPHAGFEAARIPGIAARQQHRGAERTATQEPRLIDGAAERRPETRDGPARGVESGQPVDERLVLVERDMVEERVAAVEIPADAALVDVAGDALGRLEIQRAPGAALAGKRRNREDALEVGRCDHAKAAPMIPAVTAATDRLTRATTGPRTKSDEGHGQI